MGQVSKKKYASYISVKIFQFIRAKVHRVRARQVQAQATPVTVGPTASDGAIKSRVPANGASASSTASPTGKSAYSVGVAPACSSTRARVASTPTPNGFTRVASAPAVSSS